MSWSADLENLLLQACVREVLAPKPGNVHPAARFSDLTWEDFVRSAHVTAPVLARSVERGVGRTILECIRATRRVASSNTNLGIVLLLAPLAAVPRDRKLEQGLEPVLAALSRDDAQSAYEAIRLAVPGALGAAPDGDVTLGPTGTLREMMALAADRDSIAAEYTHGFPLTLQRGVSVLRREWNDDSWRQAVVLLQLDLLATRPDTLIARKCGWETSREASDRAADVLAAGWPDRSQGHQKLARFDVWLRADGHRRNPGTTADLVAASLFAFFRDVHVPPRDWDQPENGIPWEDSGRSTVSD